MNGKNALRREALTPGSMWSLVSYVIGWAYFFCWSVSFYPQLITNYKRQSVVGLSLDFVAYNLVGFFCYSAFSISAYPTAAHLNDIFFAVHAFLITLLTAVQCLVYERGGQRPSKTCVTVIGCIVSFTSIYSLLSLLFPGKLFSWHNLLYVLSFVKLGVSVIKYIPQVFLNMHRRSTVGWSIWNIILDFAGGTLSIMQIIIDGLSAGNWTPVTENPVKFLLGSTSMFFDVIFFYQHFVLYKNDPESQALKSSVSP